MPKVGGEKFAYDEQGMEEAQEYAQETGQDVIPTYDAGGRVERIQGYATGGKVGINTPDSNIKVGQGYDKGGKVTKKDVAKKTMAKKEAEYRMKKVIEQDTKDLGKPKKHKSSGRFKKSAPKN